MMVKVKQNKSKKIQRIANRQRGTKEREMREIHDDTGGKTEFSSTSAN